MNQAEFSFRTWLADLIFPKGKLERAATRESKRMLARSSFHMLWSKAVGTPEYLKEEWTEFGDLLEALDVRL